MNPATSKQAGKIVWEIKKFFPDLVAPIWDKREETRWSSRYDGGNETRIITADLRYANLEKTICEKMNVDTASDLIENLQKNNLVIVISTLKELGIVLTE